MKTSITFICIATFLFISCEERPQDKSNSDYSSGIDWFTARGNLANNAAVNDTLVLPLQVRWETDLEGSLYGGIQAEAVGSFGSVFVGIDSTMYSLSPEDGSINWTFSADGIIFDAATAVQTEKESTKRLFFNTNAGTLYALDASNGNEVWTSDHFPTNFTSATNYAKGMLYFSHMNNQNYELVKAISAIDGTEVWRDTFLNSKVLKPIHGMGSVFTGGGAIASGLETGNYFRFDDFTGEIEWGFEDPFEEHVGGYSQTIFYSAGTLNTDVAVGESPFLIFSTGYQPARVVAVQADNGQKLWQTNLPQNGRVAGFALTQGRDPNHLIVSEQHVIYSMDLSNGSILWEHPIATNMDQFSRASKPAIWGDHVFQVVDGNSKLAALDLETGEESWSFQLDTTTYASPMVGGNTLYLGTLSGKLYAFSN